MYEDKPLMRKKYFVGNYGRCEDDYNRILKYI